MSERDDIIIQMFVKKSHHGNLSLFYIVQNLFHQSKERKVFLLLTKHVRGASQVIHLAKQFYLQNVKYFKKAYQLATKQPYGDLFIYMTPTCENGVRLRSVIFPNEKHYVYVPRT